MNRAESTKDDMTAITPTSLPGPTMETATLDSAVGGPFLKGCRHFVMFLIAAALLLVGYSTFRTGSLHAGVSWILGREIDAYPTRPEVIADGVNSTEIHVQNLSVSEIMILGAETNCTCLNVTSLPMKILSGQIGNLQVRAKSNVAKTVLLTLITTSAFQRHVIIDVVVKPPQTGVPHS